MRFNLLTPFSEVAYPNLAEETRFDPEFGNYASYYREALASNSLAYQFLCFFKIIEGIQVRRNRFSREAISAGGEAWKPAAPEIIPDNPAEQEEWLNYIFYPEKTWVKSTRVREAIFLREAAGRRVSSVTNGPLNDLRVKIAHGLTKTAELTMSLDDATNADVLLKWLPLTKCLARLLLKHQFPKAFPGEPSS